jgi:hypothetical protein
MSRIVTIYLIAHPFKHAELGMDYETAVCVRSDASVGCAHICGWLHRTHERVSDLAPTSSSLRGYGRRPTACGHWQYG